MKRRADRLWQLGALRRMRPLPQGVEAGVRSSQVADDVNRPMRHSGHDVSSARGAVGSPWVYARLRVKVIIDTMLRHEHHGTRYRLPVDHRRYCYR